MALQKWESWKRLQPILILTDHKTLEHWAHEVSDPPSGPVDRRARWHQILSKYDLSLWYIPGEENEVADILSRWAYPASQAIRDVSRHGTLEDTLEMRQLLREEREMEGECMSIRLKNQPSPKNLLMRGVITRAVSTTSSVDVIEESTRSEGTEGRPM